MRRHDARIANRRYLVSSLILGFFVIIVTLGFMYMASPDQKPGNDETEEIEEKDSLEVIIFNENACIDAKNA